MKTLWTSLTSGLAGCFALASSAFAAGDDYRYGHHMWSDGWGGMFMGGGMMVVFMLIVIVAVVLLVRGLAGGGTASGTGGGRSAIEILKDRYARGEIDTEEYNERKKTLTAGD